MDADMLALRPGDVLDERLDFGCTARENDASLGGIEAGNHLTAVVVLQVVGVGEPLERLRRGARMFSLDLVEDRLDTRRSDHRLGRYSFGEDVADTSHEGGALLGRPRLLGAGWRSGGGGGSECSARLSDLQDGDRSVAMMDLA